MSFKTRTNQPLQPEVMDYNEQTNTLEIGTNVYVDGSVAFDSVNGYVKKDETYIYCNTSTNSILCIKYIFSYKTNPNQESGFDVLIEFDFNTLSYKISSQQGTHTFSLDDIYYEDGVNFTLYDENEDTSDIISMEFKPNSLYNIIATRMV